MSIDAAEATKRLERCYTGIIHDVMRAMGLKGFVLPPEIRPLFPERKLAGPIFTVKGRVDETADAHTTLLEWTGLLAEAKPGHVVVCEANNTVTAMMGELSAETLQYRGVRGYIVDAACRDVDFILKIGFPVCFTHYTPRDIVAYWRPDGFDVPIRIGDVAIEPGDYVLADRDGIVVIPQARVLEVLDAAEKAIATENKVRTAILEGVDPREAYLLYGKF
ncbi:MAG: RraA family protein [Geminicoccaceae bacterium]